MDYSRWVGVLVLFGFTMLSLASLNPMQNASAYTAHDPIQIWSDYDFTEENGVVSGTGISGDPYIISGWEISSPDQLAIWIMDTDASFILRDMHLTSSSSSCVRIWSACNFSFDDCTVESSSSCIELMFCSDFSIVGNTLLCTEISEYYSPAALSVSVCNDFEVESNTLNGGGYMRFSASTDFVIAENNVNDGGLTLAECIDGRLADNDLDRRIDFSLGDLTQSDSIEFDGNTLNGRAILFISGEARAVVEDKSIGQLIVFNCISVDIHHVRTNAFGSIDVTRCENVTVSNCSVEAADFGITIGFCGNVTIDYSLIEDCRIGSYVFGCGNTSIHGCLIEGCNISIRFGCMDAHIFENMICDSYCGIGFESGRAMIYSNSFINVTHSGLSFTPQLSFSNILWNADYPIGGNYWSNYTGTDESSGPGQDEAGADGFGDTAYSDGIVVDAYPLMESLDMEYGADEIPEADGTPMMWIALVGIIAIVVAIVVIAILMKK